MSTLSFPALKQQKDTHTQEKRARLAGQEQKLRNMERQFLAGQNLELPRHTLKKWQRAIEGQMALLRRLRMELDEKDGS